MTSIDEKQDIEINNILIKGTTSSDVESNNSSDTETVIEKIDSNMENETPLKPKRSGRKLFDGHDLTREGISAIKEAMIMPIHTDILLKKRLQNLNNSIIWEANQNMTTIFGTNEVDVKVIISYISNESWRTSVRIQYYTLNIESIGSLDEKTCILKIYGKIGPEQQNILKVLKIIDTDFNDQTKEQLEMVNRMVYNDNVYLSLYWAMRRMAFLEREDEALFEEYMVANSKEEYTVVGTMRIFTIPSKSDEHELGNGKCEIEPNYLSMTGSIAIRKLITGKAIRKTKNYNSDVAAKQAQGNRARWGSPERTDQNRGQSWGKSKDTSIKIV